MVKKSIKYIKVFMSMLMFLGSIIFYGNNITEARADYYICYDVDVGCDAYIDADSIKRYGYDNNGIRSASADVYWVDGSSWPGMIVAYNPSTGVYYYSSGRGGLHQVKYLAGFDYKFCVLCDRLAYGK